MGKYSYLKGFNKNTYACKILGIELHSYEILEKNGRWYKKHEDEDDDDADDDS